MQPVLLETSRTHGRIRSVKRLSKNARRSISEGTKLKGGMRRSIARGLAIVTAASCVLLAGPFATAEARVTGPRLDSHTIGCGLIQDQLDQLVQDFLNARSDAERDRIRAEGHALSNQWYELGCDVNFGNWWRLVFARQSQTFVNPPTQNAPEGNTAEPGGPIIGPGVILNPPAVIAE